MALLSTLLIGVLVAHSKHVTRIKHDRARIAAVNATDRLLQEWMRLGVLVPRNDRGHFGGHEELFWQTRVIERRHANQLGIEVVRLEVFTENSPQFSYEALLSVDVAAPSSDWSSVAK